MPGNGSMPGWAPIGPDLNQWPAAHSVVKAPMEDRAHQLRRQIALYRNYLREGCLSKQADAYLRQIIEAEEELRRLEANENKGF
jgi:hypothetical protein